MAKAVKKSSKLTRIKAQASTKAKNSLLARAEKKVNKTSDQAKRQAKQEQPAKAKKNKGLIAYIKGSFREIRLVKWPGRKETWSMTLAVLIYGIIIAAVVLLLDNLYNWSFKLLIK